MSKHKSDNPNIPDSKANPYQFFQGHSRIEDTKPEVKAGPFYPAALNEDDLNRARVWFDSIQDTNKGYLEPEDYDLAARIYRWLNMRLPHSIRDNITR